MSLFLAIAFGGLGIRFGTLGAAKGSGDVSPPATPGVGNPMGFLLVITYPA